MKKVRHRRPSGPPRSPPKVTEKSAVNAVFEALEGALASGDKVTLRGFGTFATKSRAARTGPNPRTGGVAVALSIGKRLRDSLLQGESV